MEEYLSPTTRTTLCEFDRGLKKLLSPWSNPRPFVCDGNPLKCRAFIVGFNAATEMRAEFWEFWSPEYGMDKEHFLEAYQKERAEKPLPPGKKYRQAMSATRMRIEWLVEAANPVRCLETNLYVKATPEAKDLGKDDRDGSLFEYLLHSIVPQVILSHGVDARRRLEELSGRSISEGEVVSVDLNGFETQVLAVSHLSRGWSKVRTQALGKQLRSVCT